MKRDEIVEILGSVDKEKLDALMDIYARDLNPTKSKLEQAQSKITEIETEKDALLKRIETFEQSSMSEEERIKALEENLVAKQKEMNRKLAEISAKEILVESGLPSSELAALIETIVSDDIEATKRSASAISSSFALLNKQAQGQKELLEAQIKKELLAQMPDPKGEANIEISSKKEFERLSWQDKLKLKQENPDILSTLKD